MVESTFICFSSCEGSTSFLVTIDQCWKSARLRGGVETATPIHPITGWLTVATGDLAAFRQVIRLY